MPPTKPKRARRPAKKAKRKARKRISKTETTSRPKLSKKVKGKGKKPKKETALGRSMREQKELAAENRKAPLVLQNWPPKRTEVAKQTFLKALNGNFSISAACRATGIGRRTVYDWIRDDTQFGQRLAAAKENACDDLEECMYERAKKRDTLAGIFLLKGARPQVYHDRAQLAVRGEISHTWVDLIDSIDGGKLEEKGKKTG